MNIKQAFTSYNNPKGNADTERVYRTMEEELLWLREWHSPFDLADTLKEWMANYNSSYLYSTLGYRAPEQFEKEDLNSQLNSVSRGLINGVHYTSPWFSESAPSNSNYSFASSMRFKGVQ